MQTATAPTDTVRPRPLRRPAAKPSQLYLRIRLADLPTLPPEPEPGDTAIEIWHAWAMRDIASVRSLRVLSAAMRDADAPWDLREVVFGSINTAKRKANETIATYARCGGLLVAELTAALEAAAA